MNYENMTIEELTLIAKQGDMNAQLCLGKKTIGVNDEEAMYWLEEAAQQGLAEAQSLLAEGYCVLPQKRDYKLAKYWLEEAAKQNYPDALYQLGLFYETGEYGASIDTAKAINYFEHAANYGYTDAQFHIGSIYHYGLYGVLKDYSKAKYYYELAAAKNMREAQFQIGMLFVYGQGVEENLEEARIWFKRSAEQNEPDAQFALGLMYMEGQGVEKDIEQAKIWLRKAATQGHEKARETLNSLTNTKNGCYVATCVYGSYDCPEVWTLRRYRDNILGKTWYGRAFIKLYYAISPKLVKLFGSKSWFKKIWKKKLDKKIAKLNHRGIEDTPYVDREWRL